MLRNFMPHLRVFEFSLLAGALVWSFTVIIFPYVSISTFPRTLVNWANEYSNQVKMGCNDDLGVISQ